MRVGDHGQDEAVSREATGVVGLVGRRQLPAVRAYHRDHASAVGDRALETRGAARSSVTKMRPTGEHLGSASGNDFGRYGS